MILRTLCLATTLFVAGFAGAQEETAKIELKPDATNPLGWAIKEFSLKAGQKVKLTVNNTGSLAPQPHNFILIKPGTTEKVGALANAMLTDPKAMEKGFIPESPDILFHTKLVQPNTTEEYEFNAPDEAGDYPFVCTFPGHWLIMRGTVHVTK